MSTDCRNEQSNHTPHVNNITDMPQSDFRAELLSKLEGASPLDTFSILEQVEICDQKNAREILDMVNAEFESGEQKVENIVIPVFASIIDGILQSIPSVKSSMDEAGGSANTPSIFKSAEGMGLSASRIINECRNFQYKNPSINAEVYSEVTKNSQILNSSGTNINENVGSIISDYDRKKFDGLNEKRKEIIEDNKNAHGGQVYDDYTNEPLFATRAEAKAAGAIGSSAEVDHMVPLVQVHAQLKQNCMLSDADVKRIANIEDNFAVTSRKINSSKQDKTNHEYAEAHRADLDAATRQNMIQMADEAQKNLDKEANWTVLKNLTDKNNEQRQKLGGELKNEALDGAKAGVQMGIGNVIIEFLKPLYYEVADSFKNGFTAGVGTDAAGEAFAFRISRIKNHLQDSLVGLGLGSVMDIVKSAINSIVNAIIDLFFGVIKEVLKLIKKGFPVAVSSVKILFDKSKTPAERGDAVVKLLGGTIISIAGSMLIEKIFGTEPSFLKNIATCLLTGCGTLAFMALMDKLDLFSVKAEKRAARIEEIFAERAKDLAERVSCLQVDVVDLLKKQCLSFDRLISGAEQAIENKNVDQMVMYSYALADFFKVGLAYTNTREFIQWWDQQELLSIR